MNEVKTYEGKRFVITIDRSTAERGYVLHTIEEDGSHKEVNEPLKYFDFLRRFGFSPNWPHSPSGSD